jgi:hypothetical protein
MKTFLSFIYIAFLYFACAATVAIGANPDILGTAGLISGMLVFTAPGGVGTAFTFQLPFLPEFLTYNPAANPLTSLRISTLEDGVLHDWNAAAIAAMNGYMKVGTVTANDVFLRLADGHLTKSVTVNGVTAAAGAVNFFAHSDRFGSSPFKSQIDTALALTPTTFDKFTALFIPAMATGTDYADITFSNGHQQRFEMEELRTLSSLYQQVEGIIINNVASYISKVVLRCTAATPVYSLRVYIKGQ